LQNVLRRDKSTCCLLQRDGRNLHMNAQTATLEYLHPGVNELVCLCGQVYARTFPDNNKTATS